MSQNNPSSTAFDSLYARIEAKRARIGVIGLGYVGLPLALAFAEHGFTVLGFDTDESKVSKLNRGESYIRHIAEELIGQVHDRFEATHHFERLSEPDAILICVPTPLSPTRDPDLTFVTDSARMIASRLRPEQLVVLESTTYPGTTRQVVLPLLESTGLRVGTDFFLAYSPEREDPGNPKYTAPTIPKVVGGIDPPSRDLAAALYGQVVVEVVLVSSPEIAEACKILENTYRAVNIALVNELKVLYDRMGIDIWEVIDAAHDQAFRLPRIFSRPRPGRPLHTHRPLLSDLGREKIWNGNSVHRAGRRNQYGHALIRAGKNHKCPQRSCEAAKRKPDPPSGHGLQEGR